MGQLEDFATRWQKRALAIVNARIVDEPRREETFALLGATREYPSTTWRVREFVRSLRVVCSNPIELCENLGKGLQAEGLDDELSRIEAVLEVVQLHIRGLPLDDGEKREIHEMREDYAARVSNWLEERRAQFAHLELADRTSLGLEAVVPALVFEVSLDQLIGFGAQARA